MEGNAASLPRRCADGAAPFSGMKAPPVALTIAGSDSSAGAGMQADLKTFGACGVYGVCAVTCVVAETPGRVVSIHAVPPQCVREQIEVLLTNLPIAAVKTGLLHSAEVVHEVAAALRSTRLPLVIDPVMIATTGDLLLRDDAIESYERDLFPLAALITPNLDEAERLSGTPINDETTMRAAGAHLVRRYGVPVLIKGGHLQGEPASDLLFSRLDVFEFSAPFTRGVATHGTGCTYSAAITANLAGGLSLVDAVQRAKDYISATIAHHFRWNLDGRESIDALNHALD
jgi:hydroxymethylpyrimidine/phosphomethylpyrimidine kinase